VHTSLQDLWKKLNAISGKFKRQPFHPQPKREADALITLFKNRSDTAHFPHSTRQCLATQEPLHDEAISRAIHEPAESDIPLSQQELRKALKTSNDTASGMDEVTYSMLNHL